MVNAWAGEVDVVLDGVAHVAKLTLGALAELEAQLGETSMMALVERFESQKFSSRDVLALIVAGLRGGGWKGSAADLRHAETFGRFVHPAAMCLWAIYQNFLISTTKSFQPLKYGLAIVQRSRGRAHRYVLKRQYAWMIPFVVLKIYGKHMV